MGDILPAHPDAQIQKRPLRGPLPLTHGPLRYDRASRGPAGAGSARKSGHLPQPGFEPPVAT